MASCWDLLEEPMQGMPDPSLINYLILPTGSNTLPGQLRNENSCGTKNTLLSCRVAQLLPGAPGQRELTRRIGWHYIPTVPASPSLRPRS